MTTPEPIKRPPDRSPSRVRRHIGAAPTDTSNLLDLLTTGIAQDDQHQALPPAAPVGDPHTDPGTTASQGRQSDSR